MRRPSLLLAAILMGCADEPVRVVMESGHTGPVDFAFEPVSVEMRRAGGDWVRFGLLEEVDMENLEDGERVPLGTAELPDGRYDAVRVGYAQAIPPHASTRDVDVNTPQFEETDIVWRDALVQQPFCVDGGRDLELILSVVDPDPDDPDSAPVFELVSSPGC